MKTLGCIILTALIAPWIFALVMLFTSFLTGGLVWIAGPVFPVIIGILCVIATWAMIREKLGEASRPG